MHNLYVVCECVMTSATHLQKYSIIPAAWFQNESSFFQVSGTQGSRHDIFVCWKVAYQLLFFLNKVEVALVLNTFHKQLNIIFLNRFKCMFKFRLKNFYITLALYSILQFWGIFITNSHNKFFFKCLFPVRTVLKNLLWPAPVNGHNQ